MGNDGKKLQSFNMKFFCHDLKAVMEVVYGKACGKLVERKNVARERSINTLISVWYTHTHQSLVALVLAQIALFSGSSKPHLAITFWTYSI